MHENRKFSIIASGGGKYAGFSSDSGSVAFSSDGINWSNSNTVISPSRDINLSYGVGKWIAAVGDGQSLSIISSANEGINWNIINANGLPQKNNSISESKIINAEENWVFLRRYYTNSSSSNDIWCSSNSGVTWSKKWDVGRYNSIAYGNGVVIAVGENGSVLRSSDKGVTWSSNNTGVSSSLLDIAYGNGRFVAVGEQGMVLVSTNNGSTWSSQRVDSSAYPNSIESVAFGDGVFVLSGGRFYGWGEVSGSSSKDGLIWTMANSRFPYDVPQFSKVTYGTSGFIGENSMGEMWQSSGTNSPKWRSLPAPSRGVVGSEYSYAFSAKGASSYGAYGLPDGLVLNPSTGQITGKPTVAGKYQVSLYAVNSNGAARTSVINIMVSNAGNPAVEPLNFAYRYPGVINGAAFVSYGGGNYLIYSQYYNSGSDTKVALSSDGLEWRGSTILSGNNKQIRALSYSTNSNTWLGIVYGSSGTGPYNNWTLSVTKSTNNGTSWSEVDVNPTGGQFSDLNNAHLINANGVWLLAGSSWTWQNYSSGYQGGVWRSDDNGETWTNVWTGNITPNWSSSGTGVGAMAYGNSTVVAVGSDGLILRSTDQGTTWSTSESGVSTPLNGVAFGNNKFVATGQDGTILTSTNNGVSWQNQPSGENWIPGIAFGNGLFVLANGSASSDGIVWTEANNSYPYWAPWGSSITYGHAGFITGLNFSQSVGKNTPVIDSESLNGAVATVGTAFTKTIAAEGATSFIAIGLPLGLNMNASTGVISGTPTRAGTYQVGLYAGNASGYGGFQKVRIVVVKNGQTPVESLNFAYRYPSVLDYAPFVSYGGGNYLIYSQNNNSGSDTKVALSSDGLEWRGSTILSGNNKQISALAYSSNSNTWLGILWGYGGPWTLSVTKSTNNGTSWSEIDVNPTTGQFSGLNNANLINANGVWLLAGSSWTLQNYNSGYQGGVWRSTDNGGTWTNVWTGNITPNWSSSGTGVVAMAYGNSTVVAVGSDGLILRSTDQGTTWSASASGVSISLNGVAFGNNRFVATGQDGTILTSTNNGVSWENQPSGENYIQGIAFGNGLFVLANGSASSDGIVWTEANNSYPYSAPWGGSITYGHAGFITGGDIFQTVGNNTPVIDRESLGRKVIAVGEVSSLTIKTLSDVAQRWTSQGVKTTKLEAASSFTAFGLPPGLSLNSVAQTGTGGGVISGTPTQEGSYNVTVYAANANGAGSYENFTIIVGAGTTPTDSTSAPWIVTVPTNVTAMVPLGGSGTNVSYPAAQIIGAVSTNYSLPSGSYFPVGTNLVTVTATGANGQTASTNFPVIVTTQPAWKAAVAGGKQYSQIVLSKVLDTNGVPITVPGSLLAVFRGEEVVACADPKTINGMTTYGLNVGSDQVSANGFTYKFFNAQTGEISTLAESLNFRSNETQGTPLNPIVLNVPSKTLLSLKRGWNWVSFNVLPVNGTIESLLKDYSPSENDVIKGTDGLATYSGGVWYPSPANFKIQSGKMYMLSTKAEGALQISGLPASTKTLSLKSGWNWIGSPLRNAVAVDHALNKINPGENDTILAQPGNPKGGFATFSQSNWYLYADEFLIEPGKGYLLYITSPQSITF
jgi:photosystem II stability/assembly factor-like uncharacterized protein